MTDRIEQAVPDVPDVRDEPDEMVSAIEQWFRENPPLTQAALQAQITQLQAELAEAREVPGRIVAWLQDEAVKDAGVRRRLHAEKKLTQLMTEAWDTLIQTKTGIATAIEARNWSKP